MKLTVQSAISNFGAAAKQKLANLAATGQLEDQIRAPFEHLLGDMAELAGIERTKGTAVGESSLSDLKTLPDYAVTVHNHAFRRVNQEVRTRDHELARVDHAFRRVNQEVRTRDHELARVDHAFRRVNQEVRTRDHELARVNHAFRRVNQEVRAREPRGRTGEPRVPAGEPGSSYA